MRRVAILAPTPVLVVGDGAKRPEVICVGWAVAVISREQFHGDEVTGGRDWNNVVGEHLKLLGGARDLWFDTA